MITEQDLTEAIAECVGKRNPDANTCIKLAAYYTIMRELYGDKSHSADVDNAVSSYSYSPPPTIDKNIISYSGDSEFSDIVNGMNINDVLTVIEELMEVLRVANSSTGRLYNATLRKLKEI